MRKTGFIVRILEYLRKPEKELHRISPSRTAQTGAPAAAAFVNSCTFVGLCPYSYDIGGIVYLITPSHF